MPIYFDSGSANDIKSRLAEVFQTIGKLLKLGQIGDEYSTGLKAGAVALQDQNAKAAHASDPYLEMQSFVTPTLNNIKAVILGLDRMQTVAKTGIDTYLRIVGPEYDQPANATPHAVLTAIKATMIEEDESVGPSGVFYSYADSTYDVQLPTSDEPTIPDEWITTVII